MRELRGTVDLSTKRFDPVKTRNESFAGVAQLVEQLICQSNSAKNELWNCLVNRKAT